MTQDIFRKEYKKLSPEQLEYIKLFKENAELLLETFNSFEAANCDQRCMALAKTNLEQSVMWAIKAIT